MKHHLLKILWLGMAGGALCAGTGCVTYDGQAAATHEREDMLILNEKMQRLTGRLESLELQIERLQMDLDMVKASQGRTPQIQALQSSLDEVNRRVSTIEAYREKDKQETIDRLSKQIAAIMKASTPPPSKKPAKTSNTGYEHEVKPGETLSAIAAAYGVKPSVIMEANHIKDAHLLRAGQKLFIPE